MMKHAVYGRWRMVWSPDDLEVWAWAAYVDSGQHARRGGGHLIRCYQAPCHQGITQSDKRVQHASFPQLLLTNLSPIEWDFKDVKGDILCWFWGQVKMQLSAPLPYV